MIITACYHNNLQLSHIQQKFNRKVDYIMCIKCKANVKNQSSINSK